jgi:outer membrane beta-barrel protein
MRLRDIVPPLLLILTGALPCLAHATDSVAAPQAAATEQVVVPEVDRRDVRVPRFPSNDFEAGLFAGTYSTQNFGASAVAGLRLGYHISEDVFVEAVYAQTKVSDEDFRQILPSGLLASPSETLKYYNVSLGYNLLPGEVFIGRNYAKTTQLYLIAGLGSTNFAQQWRQTVNFGLGTRVSLADWAALQIDLRDHVYSLDLLGKSRTTQNLELTGGVTFFF